MCNNCKILTYHTSVKTSKKINPERLDEMTYKDLMMDTIPNNVAGATNHKLPYRDWAPLIPYVKYQTYKKDTFEFMVPSKYGNAWETYVKFSEMEHVVHDLDLNVHEAARLLLWADNGIKLHCGCPAFCFYGFQYILTELGCAIVEEHRPPNIRNPHRLGVMCKHLLRTMRVLPFHLGNIAKAVYMERQRLGLATQRNQQPPPND